MHEQVRFHPRFEAGHVMGETEIDAAIEELEAEMEHLQQRHSGMFAFANAWAERYDAIIERVPAPLRASAEKRLHRVGVRWGLASGMRLTGQMPAIEFPA
ncbi:MAG: hypothetical protein M3Q13_07465 [Pseudomonadota bacterium]|nr:hypothetical protein [Pseudomonadota bacterium]